MEQSKKYVKENIKFDEFIMLSEGEQYIITHKIGVKVDYFYFGNSRKTLYIINDFYVEILFDYDTNTIIKKIVFKDGNHLDKYLDKIQLNYN